MTTGARFALALLLLTIPGGEDPPRDCGGGIPNTRTGIVCPAGTVEECQDNGSCECRKAGEA